MFRTIIKSILLIILTPNLYSQENKRPLVQPSSDIEIIMKTLKLQNEQIEKDLETAKKYQKTLRNESSRLDATQKQLQDAKRLASTARLSWNTKQNPTCENGHSYSNCSCNAGLIGKKQMQFIISEAEELEKKIQRNLNFATEIYNKKVDTFNRIKADIKQQEKRYREQLDTADRILRGSTNKPNPAPDSFGEIEKRAKMQNK